MRSDAPASGGGEPLSDNTQTFDPEQAPNLNALWAGLAFREWSALGVSLVVVCPGSRSAPLALAASTTPELDTVVCHDERAGAFMALGAARAKGIPAIVITTSGTAVANLLPAAVEASQTGTPLILVTADRPPELRECGANQSIRQSAMLRDHARWSFEIPCAAEKPGPEFILSTADEAWRRARGSAGDGGSVHLNWVLREPLSPKPEHWDRGILRSIWDSIEGDGPWRSEEDGQGDSEAECVRLLGRIAAAIGHCVRPVIVAGACHTPRERGICQLVARAAGCPVIADIGSGLRGDDSIQGLVAHGDMFLRAGAVHGRPLEPDWIIRLGGNVSSRVVNEYIQSRLSMGTTRVALVRSGSVRFDPGHSVRIEIPALLRHTPTAAVQAAMPRILHCDDSFLRAWMDADRIVAGVLEDQLDRPGSVLCEPSVARAVAQRSRGAALLALGNSMPIRDADMHASRGMVAAEVAVSRGASGIDGLVATALGHARALRRRAVLLIGDLSLLHDIGSLALVRSSPVPITIVVVNNDGGGIFHFLPLAAFDGALDPWCTAPHGLSFEAAGALFGFGTKSLPRGATHGEFLAALDEAITSPQSMLIEVHTQRKENLRLHRDIQSAVADRFGSLQPRARSRHEEGLPPLLLIHGFLGDPSDWTKFQAFKTRRGHHQEVMTVDLAALAMEELALHPNAEVTLPQLASRALGAVSAAGAIAADIIGYSLGGRVALEALAIDSEIRVRRVMLVSAHPGLESLSERAARATRDAALADELEAIAQEPSDTRRANLARAFLEQWYSQEIFGSLRMSERFSSLFERRVGALAHGSARAGARVLRGCSPGTSVPRWDTLSQRASSIHFIVGADDSRYGLVAKRVAALGAHTDTIADVGHAVPIEAPQELALAAHAFFCHTIRADASPSFATE